MRKKGTLPQLIGELATGKRLRLAVAESCTGGLIAKMLTDTPGSSEYFDRGLITYSNEAKMELLGVPKEIIEAHGAVSEPVAEIMAEGLLKNSHADLSCSVTGISGPSGGTEEKPVGLTFISIADENETQTHRFLFTGDRRKNRVRSALMALKLLHDRLMSLDIKK